MYTAAPFVIVSEAITKSQRCSRHVLLFEHPKHVLLLEHHARYRAHVQLMSGVIKRTACAADGVRIKEHLSRDRGG